MKESEGLRVEIEEDWEAARPVLDAAISELRELDRAAVCLRFYEKRTFSEVGDRLGLSENAARMRVNRALEKLQRALKSKGIRSTSMALGAGLAGQAALAAPLGLATVILKGVSISGAVSGGSLVGTIITIMNTSKIALVGSSLLATLAVGTVFYELERSEGAQRELDAIRGEVQGTGSLDAVLDDLRRRASELERQRARLSQEDELDPGEIGPHGFTVLELESSMAEWVGRVSNLVEFATVNEDLRIPEMEYLESSDWLEAVEDDKLETVADYRQMLARVRTKAKSKVTDVFNKAFKEYAKATGDAFPSSMHAFSEYIDKSLDPKILERYELGKLGDFMPRSRRSDRQVLYETKPVDEIWEDRYYVGPKVSAGRSSKPGSQVWMPIAKALKAFEEEVGRWPESAQELRPFVEGTLDEKHYEEIFYALTTSVEREAK